MCQVVVDRRNWARISQRNPPATAAMWYGVRDLECITMRMLSLTVLVSLFVAGCGASVGSKDGNGDENGGTDPVDADSDGDGLLDSEEATTGTDPAVADTDGDGLSDGDEVETGTDPLATDSDGDTYSDFDEMTEGTDPMDAESRIYTGYWPYNPDKDSVEDPGWDTRAAEGNAFPHFIGVDQYGEEVDIYDYAMQGRPVVIDLSAEW